ncbi:hypothetical protein EYF80_019578 [Liparis tanakae]|uniref:Immunoglobulin subtype domain-containing protein n=1 Tax=Liparis tanakae TaxID=230148 RepID=A0A4Z2HWY6_9TELE|nr:hypothetical protein EYF80_019578 [Liparis tanakae]
MMTRVFSVHQVSPPCSSHVLIPSLPLQLLVLTITWSSAAPESGAPIPLRGEVGGNVTFCCPVDGRRTLRMFYLQKGELFVNGFHASSDVSSVAWANSRVVNATVLMSGLNVSHEGDYRFIIQYEGVGKAEPEVLFHLSVTGSPDDAPDAAPEPGRLHVAAVVVPVALVLGGPLLGGVFYQKRQRARAARREGGGGEEQAALQMEGIGSGAAGPVEVL